MNEQTNETNPKKVSDSMTEQIHMVMHEHINGINRLFGGQRVPEVFRNLPVKQFGAS